MWDRMLCVIEQYNWWLSQNYDLQLVIVIKKYKLVWDKSWVDECILVYHSSLPKSGGMIPLTPWFCVPELLTMSKTRGSCSKAHKRQNDLMRLPKFKSWTNVKQKLNKVQAKSYPYVNNRDVPDMRLNLSFSHWVKYGTNRQGTEGNWKKPWPGPRSWIQCERECAAKSKQH